MIDGKMASVYCEQRVTNATNTIVLHIFWLRWSKNTVQILPAMLIAYRNLLKKSDWFKQPDFSFFGLVP